MEVEASTCIKVTGLTKVFGDRPDEALELARSGVPRDQILERTGCVLGLRDVSFEVAKGEILIVMGLSGSGKSTTLRCINRLVDPSEGSIVVDGTEVTDLSPKALLAFRRAKFGMVFQQFALFPHRSILANVEYGLEVQGVAPDVRRERALEAIELVGLKGWEAALPAQLSGGMQQRAGLARALAVDANILLMDEAFSALDPLIRRDMQRELVALQKSLKKTIVFVSHDLDEAIALGGRIVIMRDGEIVQQGSALEFLTDPADDYVERFVAHIDVLGVLKARDVMRPMAEVPSGMSPADLPQLPAGTTLRAALAVLASGVAGVTVVGEEGRPAGILTEHGVVAALAAQHRRGVEMAG
ncbi:quaternary amine ABC transporter ATP-binding protein [Rhodoligotrophos defluvii]|uniref:quaternary amine ABC transporter ATP-binding protein n=1 Tax=Rhodoligotrophos defluvii TaxID=2561934 RepID=UPI0010C9DF86|nr:betaine/proline/choline family ABC transporter ATP-binding protein [Rhodoligotrophos defluvii]